MMIQIDGKNLTEIINERHENVKYLPGIKLPENIVAVPDAVKAAEGADLLIFVLPHQVSLCFISLMKKTVAHSGDDVFWQFIPGVCKALKGKVSPKARAISMIKGVEVKDGNIRIFADVIEEILGCKCSALSGANIANEGQYDEGSGYECIIADISDFLSRRRKVLRDNDWIQRGRSGECRDILQSVRYTSFQSWLD